MSTSTVRVALIDVGNCAASLVQGVEYYHEAPEGRDVPGLMHVRFGEYHVRDVQVVAAFDVDDHKVGKDLSEAIHASQNNTIQFGSLRSPTPTSQSSAVPFSLEVKLEVWDSPISAGVIIDAIRAAKIGLGRGLAGPLLSASAYFMKSPPQQYPDDIAYEYVEAFISSHGSP